MPPCEDDVRVHWANFHQTGGAPWGPYPMLADVMWKLDDAGEIVWTKAYVVYSGP